jgi:molybdenum cofactor guanylyltransferase
MVTGIVLAGGKSSRMGKDKCLVQFNKKKLIDYTIEIFKPITSEILISSGRVGHSQLGYKTIKDEFLDCGAIGGIHSTLKNTETEINILAPCDMPFISTELFEFLLQKINNYDAVIPVFNGKVEPLTGVYSRNILPIVENQIRNKKYKILSLLESINTNFIEINPTLPFYSEKMFTNINYLKDLDKI